MISSPLMAEEYERPVEPYDDPGERGVGGRAAALTDVTPRHKPASAPRRPGNPRSLNPDLTPS